MYGGLLHQNRKSAAQEKQQDYLGYSLLIDA